MIWYIWYDIKWYMIYDTAYMIRYDIMWYKVMWCYWTTRQCSFLTIKQTRCCNFSNLFLDWDSICFGQFLCLSSGWGISASWWFYYKKTTFSRCSVTPHDFLKFKRTARTLRRSTHVVFTPPQLSWLPNQIAVLRCFFAQVSQLLCRLQLRCCKKLFSNHMRGPSTLPSCAT
jgi:hypothetical protein